MGVIRPKAKATATHRGTMVEAGTARVNTTTTIHTVVAGKAKPVWNRGAHPVWPKGGKGETRDQFAAPLMSRFWVEKGAWKHREKPVVFCCAIDFLAQVHTV